MAGEGGSCSGEGGLSSVMRGWLSASVSSTCTSGCSLVAGTWGEEGGDSQREREARAQGPCCPSREPQRTRLEPLLAATSPWHPWELRPGHATGHSPEASEGPAPQAPVRQPQELLGTASQLRLISGPGRHQGPGVGVVSVLREGMGNLGGSPRVWPSSVWLSCFPSLASVSPSQGRRDDAFQAWSWGGGIWPHPLEGLPRKHLEVSSSQG